MESEQQLKDFLATPITQQNVIEMMGKAVDLIEDQDGPFEINKDEVLLHAMNNCLPIPGVMKGFTAVSVVYESSGFWTDEPKDGSEIDRFLKCMIQHDYLEIFKLYGSSEWLPKYILHGLKYGTIRWLHYFFGDKHFQNVLHDLVQNDPELMIKIIDSWKMKMIPSIYSNWQGSIYLLMLNKPIYHKYIVENFPLYCQSFSNQQFIIDIIKLTGSGDILDHILKKATTVEKNLKKIKPQIDF